MDRALKQLQRTLGRTSSRTIEEDQVKVEEEEDAEVSSQPKARADAEGAKAINAKDSLIF